jgi:ubiquinone biosynthesis protein
MIFWLSIRRLAYIARVFTRHALAHACVALIWRWPRLARRARVARLSGPERLRVMLEDMGGTFIKFGQMLALQPDIISLEYCDALFNLLDRVEPFDFAHVERTFVEELGRRPADLFDTFEVQPLATASIGQVHVATLGGRRLAVKVQRPEVDVDFNGDIRLMTAAISIIKRLRLRHFYWMVEPTSEFVEWTREELDYRHEARYMEQLRRNADDNPREHIPAVLWDFTTRRTLVAEFLEGTTLLAYLRARDAGDELTFRHLRASGFEPEQMARNIIDNFLGDVFRHGMFHADLHPANLMILPNNTVGYIDFGITGVLSRYSRQTLISLTLAYTRGDLQGMCDAFFKVSIAEEDASAGKFRARLDDLSRGWYETVGGERRLRKNFTLVMLDMLQLSRQTGVWPERDVIKYIRSAIAIDGLITRFAPTFNLGSHLKVVCERHLKWGVRGALFTYDTLLGWAISGEHLTWDGPHRASRLISRIAAGEFPARAQLEEASAGADQSLRRKATQLGFVVLTVSSIITLAPERVRVGANLMTAAVVFAASAAILLLRTVRRLT